MTRPKGGGSGGSPGDPHKHPGAGGRRERVAPLSPSHSRSLWLRRRPSRPQTQRQQTDPPHSRSLKVCAHPPPRGRVCRTQGHAEERARATATATSRPRVYSPRVKALSRQAGSPLPGPGPENHDPRVEGVGYIPAGHRHRNPAKGWTQRRLLRATPFLCGAVLAGLVREGARMLVGSGPGAAGRTARLGSARLPGLDRCLGLS